MSYCINPHCPLPDHPGNAKRNRCSSCGSNLILDRKYRVERLISDKSGFGIIYEAKVEESAKILKVLKEEHNKNKKAVELFQQEAQVLGNLKHPGIPAVDGYFKHRVSEELILHCISMEKIEGVNLEEWLKLHQYIPVSQEIALQWLEAIVEVLDVVHQKSYLHRDIKPANIMISPSGRVVLIDFGTARDATYTYMENIGQGMNMTAVVSAGYTSPEQMNGQAVQQSDFYSLGRTFVHLLTGKHPLDMYDPLNAVLEWRKHAPGLSPAFADLIDQFMARKPKQRPENAQSLLKQLNTIAKVIKRSTSPPQVAPHTQPLYSAANFAKKVPFQFPWTIAGFLLSLILMAIGFHLYNFWGLVIGGIVGYVLAKAASKITPLIIILKHSFMAHGKTTTALAFSTDREFLFTAGGDRSARIWNAKNMQLIHSLIGHTDWVYSLAISPSGQIMATGSGDTTIKLWQIHSAELLDTLSGHELGVNALAISPDESYLVSGGADQTVKVWNLGTRQLIQSLAGHHQSVDAVAVTSDGKNIVTGSRDKTIKVWDLQTGQLIRTITGHQDGIKSIALSPDNSIVFSGSTDRTVKIWEIQTGKLIRSLIGHKDAVNAVALHPQKQFLLSGSSDCRIGIWHYPSGSLMHTLRGHAAPIASLTFSGDGKYVVSSSTDGIVKDWRW